MATNYGPAGIPLDAAGNLAIGVLTPTTAPIAGTLTTNGDTVVLPISGGQWATAQFKVNTAGTATATAQYSKNGGRSWLPAPYATKLTDLGANPVTQAITATTLVTGDVWEVPLPANATHFQLLCAGTGTVTSVTLSGGALYTPGMPVTAVLYDVTSAVNTPLDTGTLDMSGWTSSSLDSYVSTATPAAAVITAYLVDDAGGFNGGGQTIGYSPANVPRWRLLLGGSASAGYTSGDAAINPAGCLPKRVQFKAGAIATFTSRLRVEARR